MSNYNWSRLTPVITTKLLECYKNNDFSSITWWHDYLNKNKDYYKGGDPLDLQMFWSNFGVHPEKKLDRWERLVNDLGISLVNVYNTDECPEYADIYMHGIPSLANDNRMPCRRNREIMPVLWELLKSAKNISDGVNDQERFVECFDSLCKMKVPVNRGYRNVTSGFLSRILFTCLPSTFVSIDSCTASVFSGIADVRDGAGYLNACATVKSEWKKKHPYCPDDQLLFDLSVSAYNPNN